MWETVVQKVSETLSLQEVQYPLLIFVLFILPKLLERLGIPSAITAFLIGASIGLGTTWFHADPTIAFLASLGIISLFLFAGMEVNIDEIKQQRFSLMIYIVVLLLLLTGAAFILRETLSLPFRSSLLFALALLTPSAGFILDSLQSANLSERQKSWIRSKVIAFELVALAVMFFALQSTDLTRLALSLAVVTAMILFLPLVFRTFAKRIAPFAPRSEFAFLLMIAILSALLTSKMGAYYLVGAFVVGMIAQRYETLLPDLKSHQMVETLKFFSGFFIPFYFFKAGSHISPESISTSALLLAACLILIITPIRVGFVLGHRYLLHREVLAVSVPIAITLLPTLVFGLVLAEILRERFELSPELYDGLVFYTIIVTMLPTLFRAFMPKSESALQETVMDEASTSRP